ncbi:MAG TPA: tetratricopeptide repeat protein [Rhodanobacteraceae bacterium]|nr:tetratricopeptide repeat protein [Rhodanobacteraceae bacterium]
MNVVEFPLHFLRPWWWLALLPLPAVLWALARGGRERAMLSRIADATLLPHLVHDGGARRRLALGLAALAWVLAVAALSGPAWRKLPAPLYVNGAARVVVLSLSNDMLAQDLKPDRMARARFAVRDLLDQAGDARTALVAYAGAAFTVAPLTDDKRTVLNLLHALRPDVMPVPGNDAAAGIRRGAGLLQQAHVKGGEIVLVTDTADAAAVAAARVARGRDIRVDVLGIGTTSGAPVPRSGGGFASGPGGLLMASRDDAALAAVARAGGGRYAVLQSDGGGTAAFGPPVATSGHVSDGERAEIWRDGGIWLLPALVVLAALAFRRGWLLVVALLVMPVATPAAHASTWSSLWSNRDQRALQALQRGDAGQAQELATTSGVRGAADYRAGDYAGAAHAFAEGSGARAQYNLGNALVKQGQYESAISAYQQALRQDPKFADARVNLDAVEAWLKKHPPPHPQSGQGQRNGRSGSGSPRPGGQSSAPADSAGKQGQGGQPQTGPGSSSDQQGSSSNPPASSQENNGGSGAGKEQDGTSAAEAGRQRRQGEQAARGLDRELRGTRGGQAKSGAGSPRAFALGQSEPRDQANFDATQRAMLRSVPDDPGALLRRKFRLEWEQRNGQQQENGQ